MSHSHLGAKSIDYVASRSQLIGVNPTLKFSCTIAALLMCVASNSEIAQIYIFASMVAFTLFLGKIKVETYLRLLVAPTAFIAIGVIVILFDFSNAASGLMNLRLFNTYLIITKANLQDAMLVCSRAMGAISCLYALSLSTMSGEIIGVLKKLRVPSIMIELMVLMYRYIFVLLDLQNQLFTAANARLGNLDFKARVRSICQTSSMLMLLSFKRTRGSFDAMQARLYNRELLFLEDKKPIRFAHFAFVAAYLLSILALILCLGGGTNV